MVADGGYGSSVRTPRLEPQHFRDSVVCLNFGEKEKPEPCDRCWLMDFVPPEHQKRELPCHHIPLTTQGGSVDDLEALNNQQKLEENLAAWLRSTIRKLEAERAAGSVV